MKERPILFSAPMVRAIFDGRKTKTRRIVKLRNGADVIVHDGRVWKPARVGYAGYVGCPYGSPGDRLWVRETWQDWCPMWKGYWCGHGTQEGIRTHGIYYRAGAPHRGPVPAEPPLKWRSPIFMPRWASRITLKLTDVRVERLGEFTEADARAEGIFHDGLGWVSDKGQPVSATAVRAYEDLWYSINGSWLPETWVWVLEFRRVSV